MVEYGKMEGMADLEVFARALFLPTLQTLLDNDEKPKVCYVSRDG